MTVISKDERKSQKAIRQKDMEDRAARMMRPEFIENMVRPAAGETPLDGSVASDHEATIVRNKQRITIRYSFGGEAAVFGKVFKDDLGPHSFRVLEQLSNSGFGQADLHRVPKPLTYFPELNAYTMGVADGTPMDLFIGKDDPDSLLRIRQAARWLAHLHLCPARVGEPQSLWDSAKLYDLLNTMTKAAIEVPGLRSQLIDMIQDLCRKAQQSGRDLPLVQTHGRFLFDNVFVNGDIVSVIDLDGSVPADPARDIAEFVNVLRIRTFKLTEDATAADAATRAFLDEYRSHLPENMANLGVHWGSFLLEKAFKFSGKVKKYKDGSDSKYRSFKRRTEFFENELDAVLSDKWLR